MLIIKSLTIRGICSIPSVKLVISSVTYCFYHLRNLVYIFYIYWQIAPAELEGLLLSHAQILDAVVIP
jgi:hypothetical protein